MPPARTSRLCRHNACMASPTSDTGHVSSGRSLPIVIEIPRTALPSAGQLGRRPSVYRPTFARHGASFRIVALLLSQPGFEPYYICFSVKLADQRDMW